ncbi:MAG: hypothetical protein J6T40_10895 [Clostridiales bacterium]|nr:hypothetical protein [Clostridiales bacterium]
MKKIILDILKAAPKFISNSSVNLRLEGWPAAVSVCGVSFAALGIAYMVKEELTESRCSKDQGLVIEKEEPEADSTDKDSEDL